MRLKELEEKYEKLLEELEAQMKELRQNCTEEDCKRWRAKKNELYWFISSDGIVGSSPEENDPVDKIRYRIGNYFKTREEAKEAIEKMKIYMQLKDLALRLNEGEKIDWANSNQYKYNIYYEYNSLTTTGTYGYQDIGQIYCIDKNFLEIAKQEIGEENLKKLFE
jgi:hypothetical protein